MSKVFLLQPRHGQIESESYIAAQKCRCTDDDRFEVTVRRSSGSLLAHNFNGGLAMALSNGFDYFAMLHADVAAQPGWLSILMNEMESVGCDVIHAPVAIKNHDGFTSTAIAYNDDEWSIKRRITTTELQRLPHTFDLETVRRHLEPDALCILPNTGCMLMRADTWLKEFPGFHIRDRIICDGDAWASEVVPEDWNFGFWCARNGVGVAGTRKVITKHFGTVPHSSDQVWGHPIDIGWQAEKEGGRFTKTLSRELVV